MLTAEERMCSAVELTQLKYFKMVAKTGKIALAAQGIPGRERLLCLLRGEKL